MAGAWGASGQQDGETEVSQVRWGLDSQGKIGFYKVRQEALVLGREDMSWLLFTRVPLPFL